MGMYLCPSVFVHKYLSVVYTHMRVCGTVFLCTKCIHMSVFVGDCTCIYGVSRSDRISKLWKWVQLCKNVHFWVHLLVCIFI